MSSLEKLSKGELNEMMKEVIKMATLKSQVASIVEQCSIENKNTKQNISKMNFEILQQKFKLADFFKTEEIIRELEFCDQDSFPLLYQFKNENNAAQEVLCHEAAEDYLK